MYTLREVIEAYYDELVDEERLKSLNLKNDENDDTTKRNNFYQDKVKNFKQIIYVVNIEDEMEQLKELSSNNYSFDVEGRKFVLMLLREFTGKMDPLRRGEIYKADSEFILELYRGFLGLYITAGAKQELIEQVSFKLYNRLDVPVRMVQSAREAASVRLEGMIKEKMSVITLGMNTLEKYEWLIGMRQDLNAVIQKWDDLYSIMGELRQWELDDLTDKKLKQISPEEANEAELDFAFSEEYIEAAHNDSEYMDLLKERSKLLGIPLEEELLLYEDYKTIRKNKKIFKHKKRKFVKDIEDKLDAVMTKLVKRFMELRTQVIRKYIPEYEPLDINVEDADFSSLCSTEELLAKALEEQKNDWKMDEEYKKRTKVELPEKSLDEIFKELDELYPVGTRTQFHPNIKEV